MRTLVAFLLLSCVAVAATPKERQVKELPQDADKIHVSIVFPDNWQGNEYCHVIKTAFETDSFLRGLKAGSHWHEYLTSSKLWQAQLKKELNNTVPAVDIRDAAGVRLASVIGNQIPTSPVELSNSIQVQLSQSAYHADGKTGRFFRRCRPCEPNPDVSVPDVDVDVNTEPIVATPPTNQEPTPTYAEDQSSLVTTLAVLCALLCGGVAFIVCLFSE